MAEQTKWFPDSRPRVTYVLPDGTEVPIIFDHGEHQPQSVTYQLSDGCVVLATRKPSEHPAVVNARLRKRDRVVAAIVLGARRDPRVTWAQWADLFAAMLRKDAERFVVACGERVSETTFTETWPMVVNVLRSWADSDGAQVTP